MLSTLGSCLSCICALTFALTSRGLFLVHAKLCSDLSGMLVMQGMLQPIMPKSAVLCPCFLAQATAVDLDLVIACTILQHSMRNMCVLTD